MPSQAAVTGIFERLYALKKRKKEMAPGYAALWAFAVQRDSTGDLTGAHTLPGTVVRLNTFLFAWQCHLRTHRQSNAS